jgi:flagellar biosynthesis/type III secretory pathway protein FliH
LSWQDQDLDETAEDLEEIAMLEETLNEWLNDAERKARIKGRVEGQNEGRRAGRQEGQIEGMQKLLLQLLEQRFGGLPLVVRRQVRAITSARRLGALAKRVLVADSLAKMGLG